MSKKQGISIYKKAQNEIKKTLENDLIIQLKVFFNSYEKESKNRLIRS
jgi:hypothetical protein